MIENEFTVTTGWFATPTGRFGAGNRQVVNLNLADGRGANNTGYGNAMNLDAQSGNNNAAVAAGRVEMVFMNEWVEILMALSGGRWNAGDSSGEGLSQYAGIVRFQAGHYSYYGSWVNQWLNVIPRQDWVTTTRDRHKSDQLRVRPRVHLLPERTTEFQHQPDHRCRGVKPGDRLPDPDRRWRQSLSVFRRAARECLPFVRDCQHPWPRIRQPFPFGPALLLGR